MDTRYIQELQSLGTLGQILTNENTSPFSGAGTVASGTALIDTDGVRYSPLSSGERKKF